MRGNGDRQSVLSAADWRDLRRCALGELLLHLYAAWPLRTVCVRAVLRLEGGQFYSATLRRILAQYHGVFAGAYSYGEGLRPGAFPPGVVIDRYVSIKVVSLCSR